MGASWTTDDQKKWLQSKHSGFQKAQLQCLVQQFWPPIFSEWFQQWPEELENTTEPLNEEQQKVLGRRIEARKGKLRSWFYRYQSLTDRRGGCSTQFSKSITRIIGSNTQGSRGPSAVELFMQTDEQFKADIVQLKSEEALHSKDPEFQKEIASKAKELCKRRADETAANLEALRNPDDEARIRAIDGLSGMFGDLLESVYQLTGWHASVYVGGPDSRINNDIRVYSYHHGQCLSGGIFAKL
ncbi:hypothetical protein BU15DRAFT_82904 [Melanogaster broomeanus]|nr:hypothetical protein BU15DRAFT_82904 [Melanogaster broomeanus]